MHLTYQYRLLPTKKQHRALERILEDQRQLYNAALEDKLNHYRATKKNRTWFDQCNLLTICRRELPEMAQYPRRLQATTLKRLDETFGYFFRGLKAGRKVGFPRFKSRSQWTSFGFHYFDGIQWDGKRLAFKGMPGGLKVHLHRSLPPNIKACFFIRDVKGWKVNFQVEVQEAEKVTVNNSVGIDLGLKVFAYQSDGVVIPSLKARSRFERKIKQHNRAIKRAQRGSNRRAKTVNKLRCVYAKLVNTRKTWLNQQSSRVVNSYDLVAVEDLNIVFMAKNTKIAKYVADASWSRFSLMLAYKAEKAGKHFVRVNPYATSQTCSGCGEKVPKSLAVRTHCCPECGLIIDRDWNAAINILAAVVGREQQNVTGYSERAVGNLTLVKG